MEEKNHIICLMHTYLNVAATLFGNLSLFGNVSIKALNGTTEPYLTTRQAFNGLHF